MRRRLGHAGQRQHPLHGQRADNQVHVTLAGLGATASGTQAAERVRSSVEKATGVDIFSASFFARRRP